MNAIESKYSSFALIREMMETIDLVKNFDSTRTKHIAEEIKTIGKLILTGEGSSRIFPAKNVIRKAHRWGIDVDIITDCSWQAEQYDLSDYAVFMASNSGKTNEVISLAMKLISSGNNNRYGLTANENTVLESKCNNTFILNCEKEDAVAATKSVVEQALFYESILWNLGDKVDLIKDSNLSEKIDYTLKTVLDKDIIEKAAKANTIYFAGFNDGVAEELTLKTNEITRKKSDFLEGTYAVHGIEEVLERNDVVIIIEPIEKEIEKFQEVLVEGVGLEVVAISSKSTPFKTILVPDADEMNPYLYLCAGWNLLVEIGLSLKVNLDKPERARKVGNEFVM